MTLTNLIAGIGWDPEIRGILSVAVGVGILVGSIYLILATNLANRLGFLVALTGLFGWLMILGLFWWIKPSATGPAGRAPAWEVEEINTGDLTAAHLTEARDIDTSKLPPPEDLKELTPEDFEKVAEEGKEDLAGWTLISEADPSRGEAQAVVDEHLTDGSYPGIGAVGDYQVMWAFDFGGKPDPKSESTLDRVANKITNSLTPTHPDHYAIIQVCPATPETRPDAAQPGETPPTAECDPDADMISVIMQRDIGERRVPVALFTIGSGIIFGLLCMMLHYRDRRVDEHLAAPLPVPSPSPSGG